MCMSLSRRRERTIHGTLRVVRRRGRRRRLTLQGGVMSIEETAETGARTDLFCDGLGHDGICAGNGVVAPTVEGARKQILNAAVKARWRGAKQKLAL
jgi:hypothetical protein